MSRGLALVAALLCGSVAARADELTLEIAHERFREGLAFYERGDYEAAIRSFESARQAQPLPALDFNIGRCLEKLDRYAEAIAAYERYIRDATDPAERAAAERRVEILRGKLRGQPPPGASPPSGSTPPSGTQVTRVAVPLPPTQEPTPVYKRWWVWTSAAIVVAAGVGIGLGVGLSSSSSAPPLRTDFGTFHPF